MDSMFDIIVVGAGTAGIPLTIFAAERGARVLVLEQAGEIGGTLHYSSGQMSGAGTRLQAARGIKDDPAIHYDDIMRISRGRADPALTRLATRIAADTIDWLTDLGTEFAPECPALFFGHEPYSVPRTHWGVDGAKSYLKVLRPVFDRAVRRGNVDLRLRTRMLDILKDDSGAVVGVTIESADGATEQVLGRNIVLTAGGYGANAKLFSDLSDGKPLHTMASPTSLGSGLETALRAGAALRGQSDYLPTFGGVDGADSPGRTDMGFAMDLVPQVRQPWEAFVNAQGDRFIAEDSPSVDRKEHALLGQPEVEFWVVFDARIYREAPWLFRRRTVDDIAAAFATHPSFKSADSLAGLAHACGMSPGNLESTIAAYNAAVASGRDVFGRRHMPAPIAEAPFYSIRHHGTTVRTFAGIAINDELKVLDQDGLPIPNLYAAGEIVGAATFAGQSFAGGMSITPALGFGRILGQSLLRW
jgi:fumarate reductase flavoprotein subunit